jgi:uncharacterized protein YndB with AHSA1/START domain
VVDIRHRIGIAAPSSAVYEQLATTEGLAQWWTRDVQGGATAGEKLAFFFGSAEPSFVMEVVEVRPNERVVWRCVEGPDEWIDTALTFELRERDAETVLLFTHAGWREPVEFMHHCTTKWGAYLLSMKHGLEAGQGRPFPNDEKISSWD